MTSFSAHSAYCQTNCGHFCNSQVQVLSAKKRGLISAILSFGQDIISGKREKKLVQSFWNKIAPEEWKKVQQKGKQSNKNTGKKRKRYNPSQCLDPFHFSSKIHDFTKQLPTRCPCSEYHRPTKHKSRDIRTFLTSFTSIKAPVIKNDLIHQEITNTKIHNRKRFYTQADRIRDQHDRGKRKKY